MTEAEIRAIFLLADIQIIALDMVENPYWPRTPEYDELRLNNPWWLVQTSRGAIEIGRRKSVIMLDWRGLGIVFPLINPDGRNNLTDQHIVSSENITKWETGCNCYGVGDVVTCLILLKQTFGRFDYLKLFWSRQTPDPSKESEWLISAERNHWIKGGDERIEVTVSALNKTQALEKFYTEYTKYRMTWIHLKSEMMEARKSFESRRNLDT